MEISAKDEALKSDYKGFERIINLHKQTSLIESGGELELTLPYWFDANMCAPFGAILSLLKKRDIDILLKGSPQVKKILQKNKFLPNFGFNVSAIPDEYDSTIEYKQFNVKNNNQFKEYVTNHFGENVHGMPKMDSELLRGFRKSLHEIFGNSVYHSDTENIFACGQHFYLQNRLDFSIVDLGIGFHKNIERKIGLQLCPQDAIVWAMKEDQTSKQGGTVPGGLGLKMIKEFIEKNDGRMQILTYDGYWEFAKGRTTINTFNDEFPGTIVNIEINTAKNPCFFESEIDFDDIF